MPFSTITPHTKPRRCGAGWRVIRAGPSTSRQPQAHGSMLLKASSPISPAEGSSTACSAPSPNSRPQSTASSPSTTDPPNRLYGAPTPTKSSPLAQEGSKRWRQSTIWSPSSGWYYGSSIDYSGWDYGWHQSVWWGYGWNYDSGSWDYGW